MTEAKRKRIATAALGLEGTLLFAGLQLEEHYDLHYGVVIAIVLATLVHFIGTEMEYRP